MPNAKSNKNAIAEESIKLLRQNKHIINLSGKEYVTHQGLVWLAHIRGIQSIETEMVQGQLQEGFFLFKATASGERGTFSGHGDAKPNNVGKMVKPHLIRMAETRAISRALRLYCGVGITSKEELDMQDVG